MTMREHPLRQQVVQEMHLRRWPPLHAPSQVVQILRLVDPGARAAEHAALASLPAGWVLEDSDNSRHHSGQTGTGSFVLEQHSEASALTLILPGIAPDAAALAEMLDWAEAMPGEVIRATRITIVADEAAAALILPGMECSEPELVSCHIGPQTGALRIWTDFRVREDRFGRLLVAAGGMTPADLSRAVQRVQELGNYRNLALLGLPTAQGCWTRLDAVEAAMGELAGDVARPDITDDALLERVSAQSLELMAITTASGYRMSATAAYAQIVEERLAELAARPIAGFLSLGDFTQRRLLPAVRTCAAHVRRERELGARADRFAALLRTRIETRIENQNARLLQSIEASAAMQLRLQQLVEGLSVVALSYYCVGLLGYMLKGAEDVFPRVPAPAMLGLITPLVVFAVWRAVHHLKARLLGGHS